MRENSIMHLISSLIYIYKRCSCKNKIAFYSGDDNLNFIFYCLGAQGCISVTANVVAQRVQEVFEAVKNGDILKARELQNKLNEINHAMFIETNPIPVKNLMSRMGMVDEEVRMPLVRASANTNSLLVMLAEKLKKEKEFIL